MSVWDVEFRVWSAGFMAGVEFDDFGVREKGHREIAQRGVCVVGDRPLELLLPEP